jgi:hypothetical protein
LLRSAFKYAGNWIDRSPGYQGATKEKVFVCAESYSVAFAVNVSSVPVLTCLLRMNPGQGHHYLLRSLLLKLSPVEKKNN